MKNPFKKSTKELDINGVGKILTAGAAAGMAIANFAGKNANLGGIIGAGLSLLIGGLIAAMEGDDSKKSFENN